MLMKLLMSNRIHGVNLYLSYSNLKLFHFTKTSGLNMNTNSYDLNCTRINTHTGIHTCTETTRNRIHYNSAIKYYHTYMFKYVNFAKIMI